MNKHVRKIIKYIHTLDSAALNRARISVIVLITLVFGNILYHGTFRSVPFSRSTATVQNIIISEKNIDLSTVIISAQAPLPQENSIIATTTQKYDYAYIQNIVGDFSAKAVIVTGQNGKDIVYAQDSDVILPMASLTKIMTAVVVLEYLDAQEYITISKRALDNYGRAGDLLAGEQFLVSDLLKIMLIVSSNDAALAFAEHFTAKGLDIISLMNIKAKNIGMQNTHFVSVSGLDAKEHYSTASDLALLTSYSLRYGVLWDILHTKSETVTSLYTKTNHYLLSHNTILNKQDNILLGSKTGYTDKALGCMITVLKDGAIIVVLGAQDRADVTEKMITLVKKISNSPNF